MAYYNIMQYNMIPDGASSGKYPAKAPPSGKRKGGKETGGKKQTKNNYQNNQNIQ